MYKFMHIFLCTIHKKKMNRNLWLNCVGVVYGKTKLSDNYN